MIPMSHHEREQAVKTVTERNQLQRLIAAAQKKLADTDKKLATAIKRGDEQVANQLRLSKQEQETALQNGKTSLAEVAETVMDIKAQMRENENNIRRQTSALLQEKAEWKRSALQNSPINANALFDFWVFLLLCLTAVVGLVVWLR